MIGRRLKAVCLLVTLLLSPQLYAKQESTHSIAPYISELLAKVPQWQQFPNIAAIESWVQSIKAEGVTVKTIGHSAEGRPIQMAIFNPKGTQTALFLAYVHPNEPAGFPVVQYMANTLVQKHNPIQKAFPSVRFLLVFAMDPDGVRRNQDSYLKQDVLAYLLNYYRGSLQDTAIYNLPYQGQNNSKHIARTKETHALMRVIKDYQPDFINELHGAEYGAMIYWTWKPDAQAKLADTIKQFITCYYPLPPSTLPISQMLTAKQKQDNGITPKGGATVDYARMFKPNMQVFNLELGLWTNPMKDSTQASKITVKQAKAFYSKAAKGLLKLYDKYWPAIEKDAKQYGNHPEVRFYYDAFMERANMKTFHQPSLSIDKPMNDKKVFSVYGGQTILMLRNFSLLYGLSNALDKVGAKQTDYKALSKKLSKYIAKTRIRAANRYVSGDKTVPIQSLVKVLVGSGLYALAATLKS